MSALRLVCSVCEAKDFDAFTMQREAHALFFMDDTLLEFFRPKTHKNGPEFQKVQGLCPLHPPCTAEQFDGTENLAVSRIKLG
jgi:hypothetical protein